MTYQLTHMFNYFYFSYKFSKSIYHSSVYVSNHLQDLEDTEADKGTESLEPETKEARPKRTTSRPSYLKDYEP